jgi:hypothetical protein
MFLVARICKVRPNKYHVYPERKSIFTGALKFVAGKGRQGHFGSAGRFFLVIGGSLPYRRSQNIGTKIHKPILKPSFH